MIRIEFADLNNPLHARDLITLLNSYAEDPLGGGHALSEYSRLNLPDTLAQRTDCHVILAYDKVLAVGLCNCFEAFSTFACKPILNIHDLFVSSSHRGQGIAGLMLKAAEERARQLGCCKLTLEVLERNAPAKSAYRRFGFNSYELDSQFGTAEFWQKSLE